jgi:hypothetical protein
MIVKLERSVCASRFRREGHSGCSPFGCSDVRQDRWPQFGPAAHVVVAVDNDEFGIGSTHARRSKVWGDNPIAAAGVMVLHNAGGQRWARDWIE